MARKQPGIIDPADALNRKALADREKRIQSARKPVVDIGINVDRPEPSTATEFLADEFDRKTFGDPYPTTSRIVYGPHPLLDNCPTLKARIERFGLHDYAEATYQAILKDGLNADIDPLVRSSIAKAISKFGIESVAAAFRDRLLEIPCRTVEYEVDRGDGLMVRGSKALDDAVARYGRPGFRAKFFSERCMGVLGMRGCVVVKDDNGDPVKVGSLVMVEMPERIARQNEQELAKIAQEAIGQETDAYQDEVERLAHASGGAATPLREGDSIHVNASENESLLGMSRQTGFVNERI